MKLAVAIKSEATAQRDTRQIGYFSYAVPGLEWDFIFPGKRFTVDTRKLKAQGYDAVVHEDYGTPGNYIGDALPLIYLDIDSTLGEYHYQSRLGIAKQAAIILVDQAPLDAFSWSGSHVYRFPYCVNDLMFHREQLAADRDVDLVCHMNKGGMLTRQLLTATLPDLCKSLKLSYLGGSPGLPDYAIDFARAKVGINWPRETTNRPHRVFDMMACGAAVLTGPLPAIDGDLRRPGEHYRVFRDWEELVDQLERLVHGDEWAAVADAGHSLVTQHHLWSTRAVELKRILKAEGLWKA